MLTLAEIQKFLSTFTYRPEWAFSAYQGDWEGIHLRIVAPKVEDSYNPGEFIDLGVTSPLPPFENKRQLVYYLAWRLNRIETHEMCEWFKVNGNVIFNPHAERDVQDVDTLLDYPL